MRHRPENGVMVRLRIFYRGVNLLQCRDYDAADDTTQYASHPSTIHLIILTSDRGLHSDLKSTWQTVKSFTYQLFPPS